MKAILAIALSLLVTTPAAAQDRPPTLMELKQKLIEQKQEARRRADERLQEIIAEREALRAAKAEAAAAAEEGK